MSIFEKLKAGVASNSETETEAVANAFAKELPADAVVALRGDLGAGKTAFVRGMAQAWGVEDEVASPTYNIFTLHRGERLLAHLDAYRLDSPASMEALMLEEFLATPYCLAIEWPEKIEAWLPPVRWEITLEPLSENRRAIKLREFA